MPPNQHIDRTLELELKGTMQAPADAAPRLLNNAAIYRRKSDVEIMFNNGLVRIGTVTLSVVAARDLAAAITRTYTQRFTCDEPSTSVHTATHALISVNPHTKLPEEYLTCPEHALDIQITAQADDPTATPGGMPTRSWRVIRLD